MKNLIFVLLFVPFVMQAQIDTTNTLRNGVIHYIADAYLSAGDSIHVLGEMPTKDKDGVLWDSLAVLVGYNDSLRHTLYVERYYGIGYTDTVEVEPSAGSALYYVQTTAAGTTLYNWANGMKAAAPLEAWKLRLKLKVHTVGSEVASSLKRLTVIVIGYAKKRY